MRPLVEVLALYKKELISQENLDEVFCEPVKKYLGLCLVGHQLVEVDVITYEESRAINRLMEEYKKNRNVFFTCGGDKTHICSQFIWRPFNIYSRLNWLDKQIAKINQIKLA